MVKVSVQSFSSVQFFATPWTAALRFPCPSSTHGACSSSCPLCGWCHPIISSSVMSSPLLALNLFLHQGLYQWVSSSHQVAKVLKHQLQQQSLNEYSGLISFSIDWFDLFADQGTFKSLLQQHNSKASILWHSVFFMVQLSHPYMTTG